MEQRAMDETLPDRQVTEMEELIEQKRELKEELDDESIELTKGLARLVVKANSVKKKAERLERIINE